MIPNISTPLSWIAKSETWVLGVKRLRWWTVIGHDPEPIPFIFHPQNKCFYIRLNVILPVLLYSKVSLSKRLSNANVAELHKHFCPIHLLDFSVLDDLSYIINHGVSPKSRRKFPVPPASNYSLEKFIIDTYSLYSPIKWEVLFHDGANIC